MLIRKKILMLGMAEQNLPSITSPNFENASANFSSVVENGIPAINSRVMSTVKELWKLGVSNSPRVKNRICWYHLLRSVYICGLNILHLLIKKKFYIIECNIHSYMCMWHRCVCVLWLHQNITDKSLFSKFK